MKCFAEKYNEHQIVSFNRAHLPQLRAFFALLLILLLFSVFLILVIHLSIQICFAFNLLNSSAFEYKIALIYYIVSKIV